MSSGHLGRHPSPTKGWSNMGVIDDAEDAIWVVYSKPRNDSGWLNLKIVAEDRAPQKANYWVSWNGTRFAATNDYATMAQHRPELAASLTDFLKQYYYADDLV